MARLQCGIKARLGQDDIARVDAQPARRPHANEADVGGAGIVQQFDRFMQRN